jgi:hypothetical protein
MATEIEIRFTGLCTFGPQQNDGTPFRSAMFVNARDGAHPHDPKNQVHIAAVLASFANLDLADPNARDFDFRFNGDLADFGDSDMVGFLLKGEKLTLNLQGSPLSLAPGPAPSADCPTADDKEGFGWVASLGRSENAKPTADALTGNKKSLILARVRLDKGRLSTDQFISHSGALVKWKDHLADPNKARPIAEVVKLTDVTVADKLHIQSILMSGATHPSDIILQGAKIELWFVNMPIEDIIEPDRTPNQFPQADAHFHHHYMLTDKPNGKNPKPTNDTCPPVIVAPVPRKVRAASRHAASNPKCPPTSFET